MANILDDGAGHKQYAPLSTSQTVAMGKHLQEQISQLQAAIDALQKAHVSTSSTLREIRESLASTKHDVHVLQDGTRNLGAIVDATRKDLGRTQQNLQQLQTSVEHNNESIGELRDGQLREATNVQKISQQLDDTHTIVVKLQEVSEQYGTQDLVKLRHDISRLDMDMEKVQAETKHNQTGIQAEREALREAKNETKAVRDDLAKTQTMVKILEQRLSDTGNGLQVAQQGLNEVTAIAGTLKEEQERTQEQVVDLKSGVKKVTARAKTVQDTLGRTTKDLEATSSRLEDAIGVLDETQQDLQTAKDNLARCAGGQEKFGGAFHQLQSEMRQLKQDTQAVRAGLKEQSSLLLPNIHMDSSEARHASARHGSLLGTSGGLGGFSPPAPGWRQEAADTTQALAAGNHTWRPSIANLELGPAATSPRLGSTHGEMLSTLKEAPMT